MTAVPATSDAGRARAPAGRVFKLRCRSRIVVPIAWLAVTNMGADHGDRSSS